MKRLFLACLVALSLAPTVVYADNLADMLSENANTATEITNGVNSRGKATENYSSGSSGTINSKIDNDTKSLVNTLAPFTKMDEIDERAIRAATPIKQLVGSVVQFMLFIAIALIPFRCACDVVYVAFPFMRKLLSGEDSSSGSGSSSSSSSNAGGYGMGEDIGGYGGYGGYGGGSRSRRGSSRKGTGSRFVSSSVITAVSKGNGSVWGVCGKEIITLSILVPALIILTMTGVLTQLGLVVGEIGTGIITSLGETLLGL